MSLGFKTQAQQKEEKKLKGKQKAVDNNSQDSVLPVHAETIDRINATFEYICGEEFKNIDSEQKKRILSDFHYYSQVEAKLQLIG